MIIKVFEALTMFDWITPIQKSVESWVEDPTGKAGKCIIDYDRAISLGWDANTIKSKLAEYGVFIFGDEYIYPQSEYIFYIPDGQFDNANRVLSNLGIPVMYIAK